MCVLVEAMQWVLMFFWDKISNNDKYGNDFDANITNLKSHVVLMGVAQGLVEAEIKALVVDSDNPMTKR